MSTRKTFKYSTAKIYIPKGITRAKKSCLVRTKTKHAQKHVDFSDRNCTFIIERFDYSNYFFNKKDDFVNFLEIEQDIEDEITEMMHLSSQNVIQNKQSFSKDVRVDDKIVTQPIRHFLWSDIEDDE